MGNLRVQRFDADGNFIGLWGAGEEGGAVEFGAVNGLGPTGIAVGPDGLVYVADTWNHRVVAIDSSGRVVREIGSGQQVDLENEPSAIEQEPNSFFGPRAVAVGGGGVEDHQLLDLAGEQNSGVGCDDPGLAASHGITS